MTPDVPQLPILVADDNPTDVFFLQRRLLTAGIKNPLLHVEDGTEAVRWLEAAFADAAEASMRPWLMFVDLKMPRMDGFEVLAWLKRRGWLDHLTTAVLSTSDEPADIERAMALGAHKFLVKYPRPAELSEVVGLAARRMMRPASAPTPEHARVRAAQ